MVCLSGPDQSALSAQAASRRSASASSPGSSWSRTCDIQEARRELERLAERRSAGELQIALFGDVSTGKSSLVNALLPGAHAETRVTAGTTREAVDYAWRSPGGFDIALTDLPGTADPANDADSAALEEARRAHVVVYVCDGDLDRSQIEAVTALNALGKPLVVALSQAPPW